LIWCTFVLDPTLQPPRVAFAIGRAVGPAVVRNRIRRRLRSALPAIELTPGLYLIGATPAAAARSCDELQFDLLALIERSRPSRA
jgi:ribonuclease P protein component